MTRDARTNWTLHLLGEWKPKTRDLVRRREVTPFGRSMGAFELPADTTAMVHEIWDGYCTVLLNYPGAKSPPVNQYRWIYTEDMRHINPDTEQWWPSPTTTTRRSVRGPSGS